MYTFVVNQGLGGAQNTVLALHPWDNLKPRKECGMEGRKQWEVGWGKEGDGVFKGW